jgi:nicotinamide riboside transporter PnuC
MNILSELLEIASVTIAGFALNWLAWDLVILNILNIVGYLGYIEYEIETLLYILTSVITIMAFIYLRYANKNDVKRAKRFEI